MGDPSSTQPAPLTVGAELAPVQSPAMDRMRLAYMAVAMRDPNPVHLDDSFAQQVGLPGAIAHGTFAISYLGAAISREVGVEQLRTLNVELTSPVFVGDVLSTQVTVDSITTSDNEIVCEAIIAIINQNGVRVARGTSSWIGR